ncbi:MAG TPA: TetR/AcrR family transcriptional regulator [Ramlibacter sp.]|jgi:AcrR family transcriptional regulator
MTRVRSEDYDSKKQVILDKAAALIARKGFDVATMMDVANACGTSKSHLYHYFPSKEDLLYGIVRAHITQQADDLVRIVEQPLPAEARFSQFVESFVRGAARGRDEHVILMNDLKYLPKAQLKEVRALEVKMTELLEGLLQELNPKLMEPQRVRKPYTLLLYGMMIWTFSWYHRSGEIGPQELAERISHLFVHGFAAEPPLVQAAAPATKRARAA